MNKLLSIIAVLLLTTTIWAQGPYKMSYQTVIRNASNALVTNQNVGIRIIIHQGAPTGVSTYVETHTATTNANGLATIEIGTGNASIGSFGSINWANGPYFLTTQTDPNGVGNYTISGVSELLSVPYALHARTADALTGGNPASSWTTLGTNIYNGNTGNVGVGTTTPNSKLHVNGSTTDPALRVQVSGTTKLVVDENGGTAIGAFATPPTNGLYVAGNVGIGTATPTHPLEVTSTGTEPLKIKASPQNRAIRFEPSGTGSSWELFVESNGMNFCERGVSCNRFYLENGGNIGVGVVPSYRLHVNGSAAKPGGGSWTNASDKRLKDKIVPFQDGLASIMAIKPVKYHYNELSGMDTNPEYVGVIAQELREVAPYMVGTFEKDGVEYFDVDNSAMMYLLINAVQEQEKEKEVLIQKLNTLEKRLEALENK